MGKIVAATPECHVDIGSRVIFVALLSKIVRTIMVDIRPLSLPLQSLKFRKGSILDLPFEDASLCSVSSLCVVEHIGLGRYGDPLDCFGSEKSITELERVLSPGGSLYLSVPIEKNGKVYFNAHRSFSIDYLESLLTGFDFIEERYICGKAFLREPSDSFCIGLFHLRRGE